MVACFYPLAFFVAPLPSASVRARRSIRLFSPTGIRTLLFCSVRGGLVVIAFVATLQRWQGMGARTLDHAVAAIPQARSAGWWRPFLAASSIQPSRPAAGVLRLPTV